MDNIVIVGASGHARVVIDIVEHEAKHHIAGLIDTQRVVGDPVLGYPVLGREANLPDLIGRHQLAGVLVAIGDNFVRSQATQRIMQLCPQLPSVSAVHPGASIARDVSIGAGTVIMAGVCVNPCVSIGRGCILNTQSSLDHDSVMEDFSSLAPRVATGGNCRIGACSAICIGGVLSHGVIVGEHSVVGAGSTVLAAIPACAVAFGTPAKVDRIRQPGDKYL
jgi:sugar O-acyltransferase (sialic acid O-acetyltransferase NeuD family)